MRNSETILEKLDRREIVDMLNRCWMTHDGAWFYSCVQEFDIEVANRLNKSAIRFLAPMEVGRMKEAFGTKDQIETFEEFREFCTNAATFFIPAFMNATMSFPKDNVLRWEFTPGKCFAYRGISRIGMIEKYECGVIYRIRCWCESLGLSFEVIHEPVRCQMLDSGTCSGEFRFTFSKKD